MHRNTPTMKTQSQEKTHAVHISTNPRNPETIETHKGNIQNHNTIFHIQQNTHTHPKQQIQINHKLYRRRPQTNLLAT